MVVSTPAPRGHHRKGEGSALAEQFLISVGIVLAHLFGNMGDVELDGPTAAGLKEILAQELRTDLLRELPTERCLAGAEPSGNHNGYGSGLLVVHAMIEPRRSPDRPQQGLEDSFNFRDYRSRKKTFAESGG